MTPSARAGRWSSDQGQEQGMAIRQRSVGCSTLMAAMGKHAAFRVHAGMFITSNQRDSTSLDSAGVELHVYFGSCD